MKDRMKIGDLAQRAGVTHRTIRYYESIGLLPPGEREGNGQHHYSEESVARVTKIGQLKKLGLSLDEIREVIDLYFIDTGAVQAKQKVLEILRRHFAETNEKIDGLQQFRAELQSHIERFEQWLKERGH